jgi:hypothetical protein
MAISPSNSATIFVTIERPNPVPLEKEYSCANGVESHELANTVRAVSGDDIKDEETSDRTLNSLKDSGFSGVHTRFCEWLVRVDRKGSSVRLVVPGPSC